MATFDWRGWRTDGVMDAEYRRICQYARRQAVRYSDAENRDLLQQHRQGFRIVDIAEYHERTVNGVGGQISRLLNGTSW